MMNYDPTEGFSIPSHLTNLMPTYKTKLYHVSPPLAFITLNRSEKLNTILPPVPIELEHAINQANHDNSVRVFILRGSGTSFCAGFDFSGDLVNFPSNLGNSMQN
ncbi:unnamed protein product [Didymodactylos carnosus]|uniref:3-hydroxyisobutyryl-coenzyme A hydrolase n=1 Tax=Didymodactylos carnosus TaxID=1234261 RepID=A0A8S2EVM4_9BILA|nr:unnamed protein product [Didymodactylos carnosus]CAF4122578.1 unnamed protein product [Didymodactylos carnosus]